MTDAADLVAAGGRLSLDGAHNVRNRLPDGVRQLNAPVVDESGAFLVSALTEAIVADYLASNEHL